jgi:hypothetical protein
MLLAGEYGYEDSVRLLAFFCPSVGFDRVFFALFDHAYRVAPDDDLATLQHHPCVRFERHLPDRGRKQAA